MVFNSRCRFQQPLLHYTLFSLLLYTIPRRLQIWVAIFLPYCYDVVECEKRRHKHNMNQNRFNAKYIALSAIIAAMYAALTIVFAPISYGAVQVRISEALTILPLFTPAAIPGLFVGCLLANILGGAIIWDIIFGSIATLIGAALGYLLRFNRWLVPIPAIVSNSVIIPLILKYGYSIDMSLGLLIVYIAIGEIIGCYLLGELLATGILKRKGIKDLFARDDKNTKTSARAKAAIREEYDNYEDDHHDEYDRDL